MSEVLSVEEMIPNKFEPKRRYRWIMRIKGLDTFMLKSCDRPIIKRNWLGQWKPEPMSLTMYDPIAPSGTQQVMEWVNQGDRRDADLSLLDPIGAVVEKWVLNDMKLLVADFGNLDYTDNSDKHDANEVAEIDYINTRRYLEGTTSSLVTIALKMLPRKVSLEY